MWTIVFLAMGGIALGKGVTSSGLLEVMDVVIRDLVDGLSLYTVVLVLSPVVLVSPLIPFCFVSDIEHYAFPPFSLKTPRLSQHSSVTQ